MQQPEEHRKKWAAGLTIACSILVLTGFAFHKGFLSVNVSGILAKEEAPKQVAAAAAADAPSPVDNAKETFQAAFGEIKETYKEFTSSLSDVIVPFMTGIEVYQK